MKKHIIAIPAILLLIGGGTFLYLAQGNTAQLAPGADTGKEPVFTTPKNEMLPTVNIAEVKPWTANEAPVAAKGLSVARYAEGLAHPRSMLRLPNGDILVAETNSPPRPQGGIVNKVMNFLMNKAGAGVPSANRITLLRDADGDGKAETKTAFLTGLNSPYGMALIGDTLYVANTDALMAFPYKDGDTKITDKGRKIIDLPAQAPNQHWTKSLVASPEGLLYVGVGSNSNIGDNGLEVEKNRALVFEVKPQDRLQAHLRVGPAQSGGPRVRAEERRIVDGRQRARHARRRPCPRLSDAGGIRRLLWLAVELLGRL